LRCGERFIAGTSSSTSASSSCIEPPCSIWVEMDLTVERTLPIRSELADVLGEIVPCSPARAGPPPPPPPPPTPDDTTPPDDPIAVSTVDFEKYLAQRPRVPSCDPSSSSSSSS
jgi:hypothetical protein